MTYVLQLDCGHTREIERLIDIGVGHLWYCPECKRDRLVSAIMPERVAATPDRPVISAILRTVLLMIQDAEAINRTGKTWEMLYDDAKARLYGELDLVAKYPTPEPTPAETAEQKRLRIKDRMLRWMVTQPGTDMHTLVRAIEGDYVTTSPPPPGVEDYENLWAEYLALFKHLDAIRAVLDMAPYPKGGLNAGAVYAEVAALVGRGKALQKLVTQPPPVGFFGTDVNSLVHLIKNLVRKP